MASPQGAALDPMQANSNDVTDWNPTNSASLLADMQMKGIPGINPDLFNLYMRLFGLSGGSTPIGYGLARPNPEQVDPTSLLQSQDALRDQIGGALVKANNMPEGTQLGPQQIVALAKAGGPTLINKIFGSKPQEGGRSDALSGQQQSEIQSQKDDQTTTLPQVPQNFQQTYSELYGPDVAKSLGDVSPTKAFETLTGAGMSPAEANKVMQQQLQDLSGSGELSIPGVGSGGGGVSSAVENAAQGKGPTFNLGDITGGALGTGTGIMNLLSSLNSKNNLGAAGGGLQTLGGLSSLARGVGLGSQVGDLAGAGAGIVGGGLGIYSSLADLLSGAKGGVGQDVAGLGSSAASLYSSAAPLINSLAGTELPTLSSALSSLAPEVAQSLGAGAGSAAPSILGGVGTGVASTVGAEVGSGAAGAGAAAAGEGASSLAGAGAGVAGGVAAAPLVAITLAHMIEGMQDEKNAVRKMNNRLRNIQSQLPGEMQELQSVDQTFNTLNNSTSPDDAMAAMKRLTDVNTGFQKGGWEDYFKSGMTSVGGGSGGTDISADLRGVQQMLQSMRPELGMLDLGRNRAEDVLGRAGYGPNTIPGYVDATTLGLAYNPGNLRNALLPDFLQNSDIAGRGGSGSWYGNQPNDPSGVFQDRPLTSAADLQGLAAIGLPQQPGGRDYMLSDIRNYFGPGGAGAAGDTTKYTPLGVEATSVANPLEAMTPGNMEQQLVDFLQNYGGVTDLMNQLGIATPTVGAGATPSLTTTRQPSVPGGGQYGGPVEGPSGGGGA